MANLASLLRILLFHLIDSMNRAVDMGGGGEWVWHRMKNYFPKNGGFCLQIVFAVGKRKKKT
jgi:hypothetical protein